MMKKTAIPMITSITSAVSFCTSKKHVIPMILSLELFMLSVMAMSTQMETSKSIFIMTTLMLMVTEGVTGLAIMIKSSKTKGNDLLSNSIM